MLTHFNQAGEAHMVDVGQKDLTARMAIASGKIQMLAPTLQLIISGQHKKGDVLGIARIAGIQGAKKTSDLIPLCHPVALTHLSVDFDISTEIHAVICTAKAQTIGQTGVEMEALTAASISALTIYDMVKSVDKSIIIKDLRLIFKNGGKSGRYESA